jgi:uncharacterized protein YhbP (UPF0306 family)
MLLLKKDLQFISHKPQLFQITTTESTLGLIHNGKKLIHLNGQLKQLKLHKVDIMSPLKKVQELTLLKPQLFQITTTESTLGLIHNGKKLIHLNGQLKQLKLHKVDIMSPLKKVQELTLLKPQLFQITTTESTLGLIHNGKKLIHLNGQLRQLKLHKVGTTLPLKDLIEPLETALFKSQTPQIITTYKTPGPTTKQNRWTKELSPLKPQNQPVIKQL